MSIPPRFVSVLLLISLGASSCGGSTANEPTRTTAATAIARPAPVDPALADATSDATVVIRIDADSLRRSSFYAAAQQLSRSSAVVAACEGDPLARIDHATMSLGPNGTPSLVVRGPVTDPARAACAAALGEAFRFHETPVRVGNALVFAPPDRASRARAGLESGENAGQNRQLVTLREAVRGDGIIVLADVTRIRATAEAPTASLPGLDLEGTRALWNALAGGAIVLALPGGDHLSLAVESEFDSHDHAEQARTWVSSVLSRGVRELRTVLQAAAVDPSVESLRAQAGSAFDQIEHSLRVTTDGTHARVALELDAQAAGTLSALAIPAITQYLRRARAVEARARIAYLSRQAVTYATAQRRDGSSAHSAAPGPRRGRRGGTAAPATAPSPFPASAPRTPAEVPRGTRVVDPAGTWSHPTWEALAFSIADPHYYSYEFVNQGTAFTVRAYGDLDGDGTVSTFERSGRLNAQGEVELDRDVRVTDETE